MDVSKDQEILTYWDNPDLLSAIVNAKPLDGLARFGAGDEPESETESSSEEDGAGAMFIRTSGCLPSVSQPRDDSEGEELSNSGSSSEEVAPQAEGSIPLPTVPEVAATDKASLVPCASSSDHPSAEDLMPLPSVEESPATKDKDLESPASPEAAIADLIPLPKMLDPIAGHELCPSNSDAPSLKAVADVMPLPSVEKTLDNACMEPCASSLDESAALQAKVYSLVPHGRIPDAPCPPDLPPPSYFDDSDEDHFTYCTDKPPWSYSVRFEGCSTDSSETDEAELTPAQRAHRYLTQHSDEEDEEDFHYRRTAHLSMDDICRPRRDLIAISAAPLGSSKTEPLPPPLGVSSKAAATPNAALPIPGPDPQPVDERLLRFYPYHSVGKIYWPPKKYTFSSDVLYASAFYIHGNRVMTAAHNFDDSDFKPEDGFFIPAMKNKYDIYGKNYGRYPILVDSDKELEGKVLEGEELKAKARKGKIRKAEVLEGKLKGKVLEGEVLKDKVQKGHVLKGKVLEAKVLKKGKILEDYDPKVLGLHDICFCEVGEGKKMSEAFHAKYPSTKKGYSDLEKHLKAQRKKGLESDLDTMVEWTGPLREAGPRPIPLYTDESHNNPDICWTAIGYGVKPGGGKESDGSDGGKMSELSGRIVTSEKKQSTTLMDVRCWEGMSGGPWMKGHARNLKGPLGTLSYANGCQSVASKPPSKKKVHNPLRSLSVHISTDMLIKLGLWADPLKFNFL